MAIVKFVKQNLNDVGVDAFSPMPKSKSPIAVTNTTSKCRNKMKEMSSSTFTKDSIHEDLINLQATLLKQTIRSLFVHTSDTYKHV